VGVNVSSKLLNGFVSRYDQLEVMIIKFLEDHKDSAFAAEEIRQYLGLKHDNPILDFVLAFAFSLILHNMAREGKVKVSTVGGIDYYYVE
jgi:hypothetical protein